MLILLQTLTYEDPGPWFCVKGWWWLVQTVILCHSIILAQRALWIEVFGSSGRQQIGGWQWFGGRPRMALGTIDGNRRRLPEIIVASFALFNLKGADHWRLRPHFKIWLFTYFFRFGIFFMSGSKTCLGILRCNDLFHILRVLKEIRRLFWNDYWCQNRRCASFPRRDGKSLRRSCLRFLFQI